MPGLRYRFSKRLRFSTDELKQASITVLVVAFVLALPLLITFPGGGLARISIDLGLLLFIKYCITIGVALAAHVLFQKIVGLYLGYEVRYSYWLIGLLITLFFAFFTLGFPAITLFSSTVPALTIYLVIMLPFLGNIDILHDAKMRLGKFRYGTNFKDLARIAFAGTLGNVFVIIVLQFFYLFVKDSLIGDFLLSLILANLLVAFFSLLPLPHCNGLHIYRYSRVFFVFALAFLAVFFLLVLVSVTIKGAGVFSFISALVLSGIVARVYQKTIEEA